MLKHLGSKHRSKSIASWALAGVLSFHLCFSGRALLRWQLFVPRGETKIKHGNIITIAKAEQPECAVVLWVTQERHGCWLCSLSTRNTQNPANINVNCLAKPLGELYPAHASWDWVCSGAGVGCRCLQVPPAAPFAWERRVGHVQDMQRCDTAPWRDHILDTKRQHSQMGRADQQKSKSFPPRGASDRGGKQAEHHTELSSTGSSREISFYISVKHLCFSD